MTPNDIAAHRVADALRTIAANLPLLSVEQLNAYDSKAREWLEQILVIYTQRADRLDAAAPFIPLDAGQKQAMFEQVIDEMFDMSTNDHARAYMDIEEWQLRADHDDRLEEYMNREG